ncbi:MAG TPA: type II toxin-antitoxin system VapC family toxin [Longimicrobium sp.]|nr:type II toxin-antitoxin system VapC family toxin [Longimicrobium sp.]
MRHYFLDTSALVKVYSVEAGSTRVQNIIRGANVRPPQNRIVISVLAHPETASAIVQILGGPDAARRGFGARDQQRLPAVLASELRYASFVLAPADLHVDAAAALVWKHRVRGADAVHLATALAARKDVPDSAEFYFVSSDVSLNRAALAEGLAVIDPAD